MMNNKCLRVVSLGCLAFALSSDDAVAAGLADEVITRLRRTEAGLADFDCAYSRRAQASEAYARAYADARKISFERAVDHFDSRSEIKAAWKQNGGRPLKFFEEVYRDKTNAEQGHWLVSFDGSDVYYVHGIPKAGERRVAQVTLGVAELERFDSECDVAILLGLGLPGCVGSLASLAAGGEVSGPVDDDGTTCTRLVIKAPTSADDLPLHYIILLHDGKDRSVRSIAQDQILPGSPDWATTQRWRVRSSRRDDRSGVWLPAEWERVELGQGGATLIDARMVASRVAINSAMPASSFTPTVEDGSNVWDEKAKRSYVAGRKPSKRIMGFIKQSAEEAKRENDEINRGETLQVSPAGGSILGPILIATGIGAIVVAAVVQRRFRAR